MAARRFGDVWQAEAADVYDAARALAEASVDEAVASWVTPDEPTRLRRGAEFGGAVADWLEALRSRAEVWLVSADDGAVAGLAMWHYLDGRSGEDDGAGEDVDSAAEALERVYGAAGLARMAQVQQAVAARHPAAPHWYLAQTAVVPALRGRGLGGALLRHHLARVDQEGTAAYLEASTPRNQALYARCGFRPLGAPVVLPDQGPRLQPMWRAGRSGPGQHRASDSAERTDPS